MLRLGISIIGRTSLPLLSWYYVFCWLLHTIHVDSSSREKTIEWGSHTPLGAAAVARPFSSQFSSSSSTDNSHIVNSNFPAWATMLPGPLCCVPRAQPSSHGKHMADSNKCWLPTAKNLGVVGWRTGYLTSRISLPLTPCNKYTESRWMAAVHIAIAERLCRVLCSPEARMKLVFVIVFFLLFLFKIGSSIHRCLFCLLLIPETSSHSYLRR